MEEIYKSRIDLLNAVKDLQEGTLHNCNADGWSILHVLEHLYLTEISVIQGIRSALTASNVESIPIKPVHQVLNRKYKVRSPEFAEPRGLFSNLEMATKQLNSSREELEALIASVKSTIDFNTCGFNHPYFGMLSIQQWLETLSLHELRHLAQIEEMIFD